MAPFGNVKWGDVEEGEEGADDYDREEGVASLQVFDSGVDADGIKTITEFRTAEDGTKTKTVRRVKVTKKAVKVNKHVLIRRQIPKFGVCTGLPKGPEPNVTYQSHENIKLVLKCRKREDRAEEDDDPLAKLKGSSESIIMCRNCGESGHFTLKCPKRDEIEVKAKPAPNSDSAAPAASTGKYVPVHLRGETRGNAGRSGGARGGAGGYEDDSANSIRVTNISEDTTENDLRDLFRPFGHTTRIFLAKDRQTNVSRGFAFITYEDKQSADDAIRKLNGYGYDNLILRVEYARARDENQDERPKREDISSLGAGFGKAGWTMQGTR